MTRPAPKLAAVPASPESRLRVCGISFRRNEAHEFVCIRAIRSRTPPPWSSSFSDFRVFPSMRVLRGVLRG